MPPAESVASASTEPASPLSGNLTRGTRAYRLTGVDLLRDLVIGSAILVAHNALDPIWPVTEGLFDASHPVWVALHARMRTDAGPFALLWAYPLLLWIGVMLLGFGTAPLFREPAASRDRQLLVRGLAATALFVVPRGIDIYGDLADPPELVWRHSAEEGRRGHRAIAS